LTPSTMRLLSAALLLLMTVSSSLGAPTLTNEDEDVRTTIETIYETRTYTVIHNVTDAPEIQKDLEGSGMESETKPVKEEGNQGQRTEDRLDALERQLNKAKRLLDSMTGTTEEAQAPETVTHLTRMCSCAEATECRKESQGQMNECMAECDDHMEGEGNTTAAYVECFSKNNASIIEAEDCLFKDDAQYCNEGSEDKTIELPEYGKYTDIAYSPSENSEVKKNALWQKNGEKYTKIQNFSHCTKHCMHKKLNTCTTTKGCGIQMPSVAEFTSKMQTCLKKNWKINNSLILACQCLAWKNGVKDLQGACVTLGNSYFVDRA
ncbi:hypothetical protein PENTCL1PPCAC_19070, partial [Pristionchus entomophagus]